MKQIYSDYTEADIEVWKLLYERQIKNLTKAASITFLEGVAKVNFVANEIPHFEKTSKILSGLTGWQLAAVPGIVEDYTFFELMSNRHFPATTWLREKEQLDYLKEPDMFHDVFAHIPLLSNQPFAHFLQELSKIGLSYVGNAYAIELLSRIYWFTVEFGLIYEKGELRIYGAGILSSAGETQFSLSVQPPKHPFNIRKILDTPYRKDVFQEQYFVIQSYEQLYNSIPEIESIMAELVSRNENVPQSN